MVVLNGLSSREKASIDGCVEWSEQQREGIH